MNSTAGEIVEVLEKVPGAADVKVEQTTGLPMMTIQIDREKTAHLGVNVGDVQEAIAIAVGGREAGVLFRGDRRFDIIVRLPERLRGDMESMQQMPIHLPMDEVGGKPAARRRDAEPAGHRRHRWHLVIDGVTLLVLPILYRLAPPEEEKEGVDPSGGKLLTPLS